MKKVFAKDMPKLESPFLRKTINGEYIVTPEITEGYEWVFSDSNVKATEKLDGTNVSIVMESGELTAVFNRLNPIKMITGDWRINEALVEATKKEYIPSEDGQFFGEVIGPAINGNPYKLERHIWIPLAYVWDHLAYKSWGKYPKTYEAISKWLKDDIFSLFMRKRAGQIAFPEGVVFIHPDGRMAKLRRDMFDWWTGQKHKE
ncbi:MAG: RNA ligase family protein [Candidatus Aenigmarchaeota archaeon]|nr:RNA ligase family protein [Candidatus Aenigmarchaeota archaeon]